MVRCYGARLNKEVGRLAVPPAPAASQSCAWIGATAVRCDQRQSAHGKARPQHSGLLAGRLWAQRPWRVFGRAQIRPPCHRRLASAASCTSTTTLPVAKTTATPQAHKRYICRGCYYIYDEATSPSPPGSGTVIAFADLPSTWVCPDCGSDRHTFRPYVKPV